VPGTEPAIKCTLLRWRFQYILCPITPSMDVTPRCNALILSGGRRYRPDRRRRRYSTFAPLPGHMPPATNPRSVAEQGQMYSTVFGREAGVREQMSGHVMLTGGRGLWTTAMASVCRMRGICVIGSRLQSPQSCWSYVASFRLTHCQDSLQQQHERCVNIYSSHVLSGRHP